MLEHIKKEITETWAHASKIDRVILVAFSLFLPYDVIRANWLDAIVAAVVLAWTWQTIREEKTDGN